VRTFVDSGVLLTAWRGEKSESSVALKLLDDGRRSFFTSQLVRLEVIPKGAYYKNSREVEFYERYFALVAGDESLNRELGEDANRLARRYGLAAVDAMHLASAIRQGAEEFITTEATEKPMFRAKELSVRALNSIVF
jgi:predicted nucleic acid-binding protein